MQIFPATLFLLAATGASAQVAFNTDFEGGNGTDFTEASPGVWEWHLEKDSNSNDRQWYYFEVQGAQGKTLTFRLLGIGSTNVNSHWRKARPVFSTDGGQTFARTSGDTSVTTDTYTFQHTFSRNAERLAFHYPYTYSMVRQKFAEWEKHPAVKTEVLGKSPKGREIVLFRVTDPGETKERKAGIWVIARQHSAEVTGSYVCEAFFDFLLGDDPAAKALRSRAVVNIVPFVNPDGATLGNYRDNALGLNLNRLWDGSADAESAPEVRLVEDQIDAWVAAGNDYRMFLDLHSTAAPLPHFAFHPAASIVSEEYYENVRRFLELVDQYAPQFDNLEGSSTSNDRRLAYHDQRQGYGVLAVTFEAGYSLQVDGPNADDYMTIETHRGVGVGIARAIVDLYGFQQ